MSCDFRAPGWLARHPMVAAMLFVIGILVFGAMAYELKTNGPFVQQDIPLAAQFHTMATHAPASIIETMTFGFFLGKEIIEIIGAILVVYFLYKKFWPELGMVLVGWSGGALMWIFITRYFNRTRPEAQIGITVHYPSFPSGHTMQTMLCFGMLAYFLLPRMPSAFWKWVIAIAAILTMLFIGFSRVYEGGHYLSDVIAGYGLGLAWGVLVYTVMETFTLRRRL